MAVEGTICNLWEDNQYRKSICARVSFIRRACKHRNTLMIVCLNVSQLDCHWRCKVLEFTKVFQSTYKTLKIRFFSAIAKSVQNKDLMSFQFILHSGKILEKSRLFLQKFCKKTAKVDKIIWKFFQFFSMTFASLCKCVGESFVRFCRSSKIRSFAGNILCFISRAVSNFGKIGRKNDVTAHYFFLFFFCFFAFPSWNHSYKIKSLECWYDI